MTIAEEEYTHGFYAAATKTLLEQHPKLPISLPRAPPTLLAPRRPTEHDASSEHDTSSSQLLLSEAYNLLYGKSLEVLVRDFPDLLGTPRTLHESAHINAVNLLIQLDFHYSVRTSAVDMPKQLAPTETP